jgi:ribosomal protein S18 acetylase RimI-like enzyme
MTNDQYISIATDAFNILLTKLNNKWPKSKLKSEHGFDTCWAGIKIPIFNISFRKAVPSEFDELQDSFKYIQKLAKELDSDQVGGSAIVEVGPLVEQGVSQELITQAAKARGLEAVLYDTMVCEISPVNETALNGLRIERVTKAEQLRDLLSLFLTSFGSPFYYDLDWSPGMNYWKTTYSYVGYIDNKIVTTTTSIVHEGKIFVAFVATHSDYRRRGYASAIMQYSMQKAYEATGATVSLLHATAMGKEVYLRLGFKTIGLVAFAGYAPGGVKENEAVA